MTAPRNDAPDRSTEQNHKDLVRQHFAAITDRNLDATAELHADDVVVHSGGRELRGLDEVLADWRSQLDAIPDLTDTIDAMVAENDRVAVRYTTTGTHEGEFRGIESTGREVSVTSMAMVRIEDGEIAEWWNHPDRLGMLAQIGVVDLPLSAGSDGRE